MMQGRARAIVACALTLVLPLLNVVTGVLIGLVTLRQGLADGVIVLAASMALAAVGTSVFYASAGPVLQFAFSTGIPVLLLAAALRHTASQGSALAFGAIITGASMLALHLFSDSPVAWWAELWERFFVTPLEVAGALDPRALALLREIINSPVITVTPLGVLTGAMFTMLLSRWCQAVLDNPGGFGPEFRALRVDWRVVLAVLCVALLGFLVQDASGTLGREMLHLLVALCAFQGLAVVHSLVRSRGLSRGWLVGLYVLIVLRPFSAPVLLALAGFSDIWVDFRRRFGGGAA